MLAVASFSPQSHAAVIVTAVEDSGNVLFTSNGGSLDLSALTQDFSGDFSIGVNANDAIVRLGAPSSATIFSGVSGPLMFGPGTGSLEVATTGSGPVVAVLGDPFGIGPGAVGEIEVPVGYVSGTALAPSSLTFTGASFASLGLEVGIYTWTWGDVSNGTDDFFELRIGSSAVIPLPASAFLLLTGIGALVVGRRARA
ncbi:MAG: VPLPA-CTERM sorting domain-containing protein [Pseudomonadota bacterium]